LAADCGKLILLKKRVASLSAIQNLAALREQKSNNKTGEDVQRSNWYLDKQKQI
jgi:hypothetical protein